MQVEESCVRLFVSVDLVGSTAYKNKREADARKSRVQGPPWANVFSNFYSGFPKMFERELDQESLPPSLRPKLVKTIGDEVLLQTPIESSWEANRIVCFLAKALVDYKQRNLYNEPLLLKATAWIAGFPINNHRIRLEEEGGAHGVEDFIGPSIDTGFRITEVASPSKLVVAVDLALLLLSGDHALDLYFEGTQTLKGVLGGRPYPIIWYKVPGEGSKLLEAELKLRQHEARKVDLRSYCEEYILSCSDTWLIRPYLKNDAKFKDRPPLHDEILATWAKIDDRNMSTGPEDG